MIFVPPAFLLQLKVILVNCQYLLVWQYMTANKENRGDARLVLTKQEAHEIFDFVEMHNVEVSHELCVLLTQMSNKMFPSTAKRTFRDTETIFMEAKYLLARAMRDERLPLIRAATQDIQRELDAYLAL